MKPEMGGKITAIGDDCNDRSKWVYLTATTISKPRHYVIGQCVYCELELMSAENARLKSIIAKKLYENDEFEMEYTGIVLLKDENAKLKKKLERAVEALEDAYEFIDGVQDNLFHYYENKCIPTIYEVNAPVSASAGIRVVIAELKKELEAE